MRDRERLADSARQSDPPVVTTTAPRSTSIRVGWLLVGVGLLCGVVAALVLVTSVGRAFQDALMRPPCATPCSEVLDLDAGHYLVFEEIGRSRSVGPFSSTTEGPTSISPADVTVTAPAGRVLDIVPAGSSQTIDRNGAIYADVVSFRVSEAGRYRIVVDAPRPTRILVAPGLGQTFAKALPGIGVAVVGFALGMTGLVLLVVAWVDRRTGRGSAGRGSAAATGPPSR